MDLGLRYKRDEDIRKTAEQPKIRTQTQRNTVGPSDWDRYARRPNTQQSVNEKRTSDQKSVKNVGSKGPTDNKLNRYYRSQAAPKNQFKHYLSDSNNVFYEDRKSLKQLNMYKSISTLTCIVWLILLIIYIVCYFIHPFQGPCPHNAQCGVFVHCFSGFKYDPNLNQCVLSQQLYDQIQSVCTDRILIAREQWGQQQCQGKDEVIPQIKLDELLAGISNRHLKNQLVQKLQKFLTDVENQQSLHFSYHRSSETIIPTKKKYSLTCKIQRLFGASGFKIGFPAAVAILVALIMIFKSIRRRVIAHKIYQELRKRTLAEKMLNISYAKADLQKQYGVIDEGMWELVDQYRTKERDIGFLQDDFLYWKML